MTLFSSHSARQRRVPIEDPSSLSEARRAAASLARLLQFDDTAAGTLALGVTEAASNIVKHAGQGEILLQCLTPACVEVIAIDKGPGLANVAESLRDGYSTAGSPGTGLGALQRTTSSFELYTGVGDGTILRFDVRRRGIGQAGPVLGAVCLPMPGESVSGDALSLIERPGRRVLFVVDGLGHGPDAAAAARMALEAASKHAARAPAEILAAVDVALRATRGAAAAVAVLDAASAVCTFCGVGNIAASLHLEGNAKSMVSHGGILGHQVSKMQEFQYPAPKGALCIMHSDGLATRWDLGRFPGLELRHPALIAAALYRGHRRGRDDVAVLAARTG